MDVYALTQKKRPTHLTLGQPIRSMSSDMTDSPTTDQAQTSLYSKRESLQSIDFMSVVTGPPSRDHWKPDADALVCGSRGCNAAFGLFERRHHCRRCGDIFCSNHCSSYLLLDQSVRFHPKGVLSRGCDSCADDYARWKEALERAEKESVQDEIKNEENSRKGSSNRHAGIMTHQPQAMEGILELGRDDIVQPADPHHPHGIAIKSSEEVVFNPIPSVPADWQWSTF